MNFLLIQNLRSLYRPLLYRKSSIFCEANNAWKIEDSLRFSLIKLPYKAGPLHDHSWANLLKLPSVIWSRWLSRIQFKLIRGTLPWIIISSLLIRCIDLASPKSLSAVWRNHSCIVCLLRHEAVLSTNLEILSWCSKDQSAKNGNS